MKTRELSTAKSLGRNRRTHCSTMAVLVGFGALYGRTPGVWWIRVMRMSPCAVADIGEAVEGDVFFVGQILRGRRGALSRWKRGSGLTV
ncbi:hypothetical protein BDV98DRAFT_205135 [Pterulicium gracile]|uniref:Uncharacterized protein n=1 Tax=Pterulicium gracile TaxID=1884261 RepID=A0A5C3QBP6_9AGAR|nr:hypothetical protein BDV98DRAFT_205135 [Pterula gracilis]